MRGWYTCRIGSPITVNGSTLVAKRARERAKTTITVDGSTRSGEARKRACEDNYYIALTKKIAYKDFRNTDLFGRKSGDSVKEKI